MVINASGPSTVRQGALYRLLVTLTLPAANLGCRLFAATAEAEQPES